MKKLLFLTAIVSLLFVGCNNDNYDPSTETVRLLPSRIIATHSWGSDTVILEYDGQNRLVRLVGKPSSVSSSPPRPIVIMYDANSNPTNAGDKTFRHIGNQVVAYGDTLTIGANGRLEGRTSWAGIETFVYDSRGNLTKILRESESWDGSISRDTTEFEYANSNARSIWRHVNVPDWFVVHSLPWFIDWALNTDRHASVTMTRNGLMPTQVRQTNWAWDSGSYWITRFDYGIYPNGYISHITIGGDGWGSPDIWTIEWIPAR